MTKRKMKMCLLAVVAILFIQAQAGAGPVHKSTGAAFLGAPY